jgi:hypothetical protein
MSTPSEGTKIVPVKTPFDSSLSYLYKQAIYLGVPLRYVLAQPANANEGIFIESFDLDEHTNAKFITLFNEIRNFVTSNPNNPPKLVQVWEHIQKFQGEQWNPTEIIPIWLHSIPEYRVNNWSVFNQVKEYLDLIGDKTLYQDMNDIIKYYQEVWLPFFNAELTNDKKIVESHIQVQKEISVIQPIVYSNIELTSVTVTYDLSYPFNPLPDFFNSSVTSYVVPFIQYNIKKLKGLETEDAGARYYKIYKGKTYETQPLYGNIVVPSSSAPKEQTIYLHIWSGGDETAHEGKKEGFLVTTISYSTITKMVHVEINSPYDEIRPSHMVDRFHQAIPLLPKPTESQIKESKIKGNFMLYQVDLFEHILAHMIFLDPLFQNYLYIDEAQKIFAEKDTLNINYKGAISEGGENTEGKAIKAAVSASIKQDIIPKNTQISIMEANGTVTKRQFEQDILVVRVNMTKASNRKVAEQFVNILARLFRIYINKLMTTYKSIVDMVPEYALVVQQKQTDLQKIQVPQTVVNGQIIVEADSEDERRITALQRAAPDIFVKNYARNCQKPRQPLPIRSEEAPIWREKYVRNKSGQFEQRQVFTFPPNNPSNLFVCPGDKYPYAGVTSNVILTNSHQYPLIPCCFGSNQTENPSSEFYRYYSGIPAEQIVREKFERGVGKSSHRMKTDRVLTSGRFGFVNTLVSTFVKKYSNESGVISRYGVERDTNSFIHCVATAMSDPNYQAASDKKKYVKDLRAKLSAAIKPELLKQELYDMNNEEITNILNDDSVFFDPLIFYRAIETVYNCTVYIFAHKDKDEDTTVQLSLLQLPRHTQFHVHPPTSGKPVILVLRHRGAKSDGLKYPQCELIVDERISGQIIGRFDDSMNKLIYPALTFVARTLTWEINPIDKILTARQNIYSSLNYPVIFGQIQITGQVIDQMGKVRMLCLAPEINKEGKGFTSTRIFVNVPPTAPLNIRSFNPEDAKALLPPYEKLIEAFGKPTQISSSSTVDGVFVTGLWFAIGDLPAGIECPCLEIPLEEFRKANTTSEGQTPPEGRVSLKGTRLISNNASIVNVPRRNPGISSLDKIRTFRRASRFIIQIVRYLYVVAGRPDDIRSFIDTIIIRLTDPEKHDSYKIYNMSSIQRILPKGTVQTILAELHKQVPKVFVTDAGRLLIYDNDMEEGLLFSLSRFARDYRGLTILPESLREISDFYSVKQDFKVDNREFILGSLAEYNSWSSIYVPSSNVQQRDIQNLKIHVQTHLLPNAYPYQEPYIYQRSDNTTIGTSLDPREDKFYLVQNVAAGDKARAIAVSYRWFNEKINGGFYTKPYTESLPVHVVYRISQGGGIVVDPEEDRRSGAELYLELLNYGNGMYAALLPIL